MMFLASGAGIIDYIQKNYLYTKLKSAWVIDLNMKHETTKLTEENRRKYL